MGFQLQGGRLTTALRRLGGLRGVISPDLDESVVGIIDLSQVPWREDGVQWVAGGAIGAAVGNQSTVSMQDDRPNTDQGVVWIDGCMVSGVVAGVAVQAGWGAAVLGGGIQAFTAELPKLGLSTLQEAVQGLPIRAVANNGVAASRITILTGLNLPVPFQSSLYVPLGVLLPPATAFYLETTAANLGLFATFYGRFWRQVG
jgi:hypothetical protein